MSRAFVKWELIRWWKRRGTRIYCTSKLTSLLSLIYIDDRSFELQGMLLKGRRTTWRQYQSRLVELFQTDVTIRFHSTRADNLCISSPSADDACTFQAHDRFFPVVRSEMLYCTSRTSVVSRPVFYLDVNDTKFSARASLMNWEFSLFFREIYCPTADPCGMIWKEHEWCVKVAIVVAVVLSNLQIFATLIVCSVLLPILSFS